jgi:carboxymethylenebutenolidase
VNTGIRRKCEDWAALGYLALAPNVFWHFAPSVERDPEVLEQIHQAFEYF